MLLQCDDVKLVLVGNSGTACRDVVEEPYQPTGCSVFRSVDASALVRRVVGSCRLIEASYATLQAFNQFTVTLGRLQTLPT